MPSPKQPSPAPRVSKNAAHSTQANAKTEASPAEESQANELAKKPRKSPTKYGDTRGVIYREGDDAYVALEKNEFDVSGEWLFQNDIPRSRRRRVLPITIPKPSRDEQARIDGMWALLKLMQRTLVRADKHAPANRYEAAFRVHMTRRLVAQTNAWEKLAKAFADSVEWARMLELEALVIQVQELLKD